MLIPAPFDLYLDCAFLVFMLHSNVEIDQFKDFFFFNLWVIDL